MEMKKHPFSFTRKSLQLLADIPADAENDLLNFRDYRDAIISILVGDKSESLKTQTIGIFGSWGSGKTTLLRMIQDKLQEDKLQTIWVNIWQFGNEEDVWSAFLQGLLLSVKREMPWFRQFLYHSGVLIHRVDWSKAPQYFLKLAIRILVVVIPLYLSLSNLLPTDELSSENAAAWARSLFENLLGEFPFLAPYIAGAGTLFGIVLTWYLLLRPYVQAVRERVNLDLGNLIKSAPLKERVVLIEQLKSYFRDMVVNVVGSKGRLIIFIDDLDRCPPERIVNVLDSMKLFLDIPNCAYLLGLDREIIEQALAKRFEDYSHPSQEAREYLDKIIGLPFDLPPLSTKNMTRLVSEIGASLPDEERCIRVFALGQESNPRRVKRTLNVFLLTWTLAQQRSDIREIITPVRLAKMIVIQQSYPELYQKLLRKPDLLGQLELHYRRDEKVEENIEMSEKEQASELLNSFQEPLPKDRIPASKKVSVAIPDDLKEFVENSKLQAMLTAHPSTGRYSVGANFTEWSGDRLVALSDDEIRNYITLTYVVSAKGELKTESGFDVVTPSVLGPIIGGLSAQTVNLWGKADRPGVLRAWIGQKPDLSDAHYAGQSSALIPSNGFTGMVSVDGLTPNTRYYYSLSLLKPDPAKGPYAQFTTMPADGEPKPFAFAIGSAIRPGSRTEGRIFRVVERQRVAMNLLFMLFTGNQIYADMPAYNGIGKMARTLKEYRDVYLYSWSRPAFQSLLKNLPVFMTLGDHEVIKDWVWTDKNYKLVKVPRSDRVIQALKGLSHDGRKITSQRIQDALEAYWEHQAVYAPSFQVPGLDENYLDRDGETSLAYSFTCGAAAFFVMDTRTRRVQSRSYMTMLGEEQWNKLEKWLLAVNEKYPVKFLVSSSSFLSDMWLNLTQDHWPGFQEEREKLLDFIASNGITGVYLLTGNLGATQVIQFDAVSKDGKRETVWEFSCSPLEGGSSFLITNQYRPLVSNFVAKQKRHFIHNGNNVGIVSVYFSPEGEYRVGFEVYGIDGEKLVSLM